jgi:hypothetical protein
VGRGRKYFISMVQESVVNEVLEGKQLSLDGVPRERNTPMKDIQLFVFLSIVKGWASPLRNQPLKGLWRSIILMSMCCKKLCLRMGKLLVTLKNCLGVGSLCILILGRDNFKGGDLF